MSISWAYDLLGPFCWTSRGPAPEGGVRTREGLMAALVLHEYAASGNCYKIRLTAALLGIPLERRQYDILKGETRTALGAI